MKRLKKSILVFGVIILLIIAFRGFLYRSSINYTQIHYRKSYILNDKKLIKEINEQLENKELSLEEIVQMANEITSSKLNFTFDKVQHNPNLILKSKIANCIGYSSLFNSVGNYIIERQKMTDKYEFSHLVGKLTFLGYDVHKLFDSPFFKDHDFNKILDKSTGKEIYVDPSIRDYLRIDYVTSN